MAFREISGPNGSKIVGGFSSKMKMKLKVNSIKVRKKYRQYNLDDNASY